MRVSSSPSSSRVSRTAAVWSFAALAALALATGCFESGTQPAAGGSTAATSSLPLDELAAQAGLSGDQAAALTPAHGAWQRDEAAWSLGGASTGEPPALDFLAASAPLVGRSQIGRLAAAVHVYEASHVSIPVADDPLLTGASGRGQGIGGGRGGRGHGGRGPGGPGHPGDFFGELGLSPGQMTQLRAARQTLMTTVHDLILDLRAGTISQADFETGVEAAQAAFETSVQTILTAEQYAQLQTARRDRLIRHLTARVAAFDANVTRHVTALDRILDLSEAQVTGITAILQDSKPGIEAVLAGLQDNSLSPQAAQAQLKQLVVGTAAAIRATLTAEQAAIFDTLAHLRRLFPGCRP